MGTRAHGCGGGGNSAGSKAGTEKPELGSHSRTVPSLVCISACLHAAVTYLDGSNCSPSYRGTMWIYYQQFWPTDNEPEIVDLSENIRRLPQSQTPSLIVLQLALTGMSGTQYLVGLILYSTG